MFNNLDSDRYKKSNFHQRVADENIQNVTESQQDILQAKNGFVGMVLGVFVGGVVGWLFLSPSNTTVENKSIPIIYRPEIAARVVPNDPGGMDIDNQDRKIYNIVDNQTDTSVEIKVQPMADKPQFVVETLIQSPETIDALVENLDKNNIIEENDNKANIILAEKEIVAVKTDSQEKIIIPAKIENVKIEEQLKSINNTTVVSPIKKNVNSTINGDWYTQITASSNRQSVDNLWKQLSLKHSFINEYSHQIEKMTTADGKVLYRLKLGSFKTRDDALKLCNKLKDKQIGCIIKQN